MAAAALAALTLACRNKVYRVPSSGMSPTIAEGEFITVDLHAYDRDLPRHGDLVVCRWKGRETPLVRRVIALPGETIEIRDKSVLLQGKPLRESYAVHGDFMTVHPGDGLRPPYDSRDELGPMTLPPDAYFVMGDNRDYAFDSRYLGAVPLRDIVGKVVEVLDKRMAARPVR